MLNTNRNQILKRIAIAGVSVLAIGLVPNWEHQIKQLPKFQILGATHSAYSDVNAAPELVAILENPELTAKSALAYDFQSGSILFTHNFDQKLPVASLTKLVTALVVVDSGKLNTFVEVQEEDVRVIGPNTGLLAQERILTSELLKAMLIASHNDSTLALSRHVGGTPANFVKLMNQKAKQLGMHNTNFTNPIGFDDPNHFSSAHDYVLALKSFLNNTYLSEIVKTKQTVIESENKTFTHHVKTTNKLLLDDPTVVGVKTGYTTEARGNLVIRSVNGKTDVVTIVLGSEDREGDTRKMLDWVNSVYRW
ncbi:MAG TPA: serine hydrolase [Candidatus Binatia bacterium]|nr:serine hydrolase [Candidatus Binatia bacterium]